MNTKSVSKKPQSNAVSPLVSNSTIVSGVEIIEKFVSKWKNTDKYSCPKCGKKLGMPNYKCDKCNIQLKLKMRF